MFETKVVPAFGGGINLAGHSAGLRDDEWTWADGFEAARGCAQLGRRASLIKAGSGYVPGATAIVGICPDLMTTGSGNTVLVATRNNAGGAVRLWQITSSGTTTEKTASGTAATGVDTSQIFDRPIMLPAQLNGLQLLAFGNGASHSIATYDGTNHTRIAPGSFTLKARFLIASQGYVIAAATDTSTQVGRRTIRISDASAPTVWEPATSNSADAFAIDFCTEIRGVIPTASGGLVFGGDRIVQLTATGGIPPFTVRLLAEQGMPARMGMCVNTPLGPVFAAARGLMSLQGMLPGSDKSEGHALNPFATGTSIPKLLWDERIGAIVVATDAERWFFDPVSQAWWRASWEATPVDHTMGMSGTHDLEVGLYSFVTSAGDVYQVSTSSFTNAFVDTKDFAFMEPSDSDYIDRILVDWEPLNNASTDAIEVSAFTRNEMRSSGLGATSFAQDYTSSFTSLGTLTGSQRELSCRLRGRYTRFRFAVASGAPVRIRGFSIRRQRGSDRAQ